MIVSPTAVISAYSKAARIPGAEGADPSSGAAKPSFGDALRQVGADAAGIMRHGEQQTLAALSGKADVAEVVTAVAAAEVTLQTVVAVRDRVIQAYQEVLRMPI